MNANTSRSTKNWIVTFGEWATIRGKNPKLEDYIHNKADMDCVLGCFYAELRKKDGKDYEPDCLRVMQASLQRHLFDKKTGVNILSDDEFEASRRILEGKARELRQMGMGKRPNASEAITNEEEEMLWELGRLGRSSPDVLLHTVWYHHIQHFGLRGGRESATMRMDQFRRCSDEDGNSYIEFFEDPTKCRGGGLKSKQRVTNPKMFATGDDRCPVRFFDLYTSKRPAELRDTGRFFLIPRKLNWKCKNWYDKRPIGHNSIATIMRKIVDGTPISSKKKVTNHSGRKTLIKKLKKAKIPECS